jgi:hypothetical protein
MLVWKSRKHFLITNTYGTLIKNKAKKTDQGSMPSNIKTSQEKNYIRTETCRNCSSIPRKGASTITYKCSV